MDIKYIAGLFDSDGCFTINPYKRTDGRYKVNLSCSITQKRPQYFLNNLCEITGSNLIYEHKWDGYKVTLSSHKARRLTSQLIPHMVVKKDIAEYILGVDGEIVDKKGLDEIRAEMKKIRDNPKSSMTPFSNEWAAGYIDGDGCIKSTLHRKRNGTLQFKLCIDSHVCQRQAVDLLTGELGGSSYIRKDKDVICYNLSVSGNSINRVSGFIKHLRFKKEQFEFVRDVIRSGEHFKENGATYASNSLIHEKLKRLKQLKEDLA